MSKGTLRIGIGQIPSLQADIDHNLGLIEQQVDDAHKRGVQMLVFPELALTGYLTDSRFSDVATRLDSERMNRLRALSEKVDIAIGFIEETTHALFYNSSAYLSRGQIVHLHRKIYLPTYGKFDERRYFGAGWNVAAFDTEYIRTAMLICGDAWHLPLAYMAAHDGADLLVVQAASSREGLADTTPCEEAWQWMCRSYALTLSCFVVFANLADAKQQGSYTFWGGSFIVGPDGRFLAESGTTDTDLIICDLDRQQLRDQRIKLPFRRDDSLAHTLELGQLILSSKMSREPHFSRSVDAPSAAAQKPR